MEAEKVNSGNGRTEYWTVDPEGNATDPQIKQAGEWLRAGKLVAFPTESVYGLGADARNQAALERLFRAKGRPADNPLIVHIAKLAQLAPLVKDCNNTASRLIEQLWPGPLTLVLPMKEHAVAPEAVAGLSTIAVRMPGHPVAAAMLLAADCPIAAPSANRSGRPSPTTAEHVRDDMDGRIDAILDGGPSGVGLESTVVECTEDGIVILRPGAVTAAQLQQASGGVRIISGHPSGAPGERIAESAVHAPRAPGMKYRHYAPRGKLTLVEGNAEDKILDWMQHNINQAKARGERTGILAFSEHTARLQADVVLACGSMQELESMAYQLYALLRAFDHHQVTYILAEACKPEGLGEAIMNRLLKAADNRLVHVV